MDFRSFRLRACRRRLRAYTLMDSVARHFTVGPFPKNRGGKFRKDDSGAKWVRDYIAERYLHAMIYRRKGRYEPRQIVRNFMRS